MGAFLTEDEAVRLANETGATFKEDAGRGWRQVVASPAPVRIVEFDAIKDLVDDGYLVVSTGGGGVPVIEEDGGYRGVPAVIDKDRSSAKLAADFKADMLVILTAVPKVAINFNTPDQQDLDVLTVAEAAQYIEEGQFASGSMLPKVEACIAYLQAYPEGKAIITSLENAAEAIEGESGTLIDLQPGRPRPHRHRHGERGRDGRLVRARPAGEGRDHRRGVRTFRHRCR